MTKINGFRPMCYDVIAFYYYNLILESGIDEEDFFSES